MASGPIDSYKTRDEEGTAFYVDVYLVEVAGETVTLRRMESKHTGKAFWEVQDDGSS